MAYGNGNGHIKKPPSVYILGTRIHNVSMDSALRLLETMAKGKDPNQIVTVNPEFIMTARKNERFRKVINNASLAVPDGTGVLLAGWLTGKNIKERVAGVDLVEKLAAIAGRERMRLFFLGARPGVAERAAVKLHSEHPGFIIAGTYAGSPDPLEEDEICTRITEASPHVLFVAYGAPQQDIWISRNLKKLNVPVAIGVGGTFDFIAGEAVRAPVWVQKTGFEWLHRLLREPYRWRRMLVLPEFLILIIRDCSNPDGTGEEPDLN